MATLYIIQNETHLINFTFLSKNNDDVFLITDLFCGFEIEQRLIDQIDRKVIRLKKKKGFYRVNFMCRLYYILNLNLKNILNEMTFEKIVIGNDGAVQKKVFHYLKRRKKNIKVVLWSDGLLEKVSKNWLRNVVSKYEHQLFNFKIDPYLPSISCTSSMIDDLFVMTESCKNSAIYNGFKGNIDVVIFPRHLQLAKIKRTNSNFRVLFVVSAFAWHGRDDIEAWETELVRKLIFMEAEASINFEISIRAHPRSSRKLTEAIKNSKLSSKYSLCEEDIVNSDIIISYASTCLLDGYSIDKKVFVYEQGAPYINRGEFIESLPKLKDLNMIKDIEKYDM
ncbi:hypothetical protein NTH44_003647 [Vibrio metoecus]